MGGSAIENNEPEIGVQSSDTSVPLSLLPLEQDDGQRRVIFLAKHPWANNHRVLSSVALAAEAMGGVNTLVDVMHAAPWFGFISEILRRALGGEERKNLSLEDRVADIGKFECESTMSLDRGWLLITDANKYSNFQYAVGPQERINLNNELWTRMKALADKFGVPMLHPPPGDLFSFYIPRMGDDDEDRARLVLFMQAVENLRVSTGIRGEEQYEAMGLNPDHYPGNCFTFSTGVIDVEPDQGKDITFALATGPKALNQGFVGVYGRAYVDGLTLQEGGKTAEYWLSDGIVAEFDNFGFEFDAVDSELNGRRLTNLTEIQVNREVPKLQSIFNKDLPGASEVDDDSLAYLAASTIMHPKGSIAALADAEDEAEKKKKMKLGLTSIAFNVGSRALLATDVSQYLKVKRAILEVMAEPQFSSHFKSLKQDATIFHVQTQLEPKMDNEVIMNFCAQVDERVNNTFNCQSGENLQIGVAYTDAMLVTRYKGTTFSDVAGDTVVKAVRLAKAKGFKGRNIILDSSYCFAAGHLHELETVELKGGAVQCLATNREGVHDLKGRDLLGVEVQQEEIFKFIDTVSENGDVSMLVDVDLPCGVEERSGYGISALLRSALRYAKTLVEDKDKDNESLKKVYNITRIGDGDLALVRGLLFSVGLLTRDQAMKNHEEGILVVFNDLLLDEEIWQQASIIFMDLKDVTDREFGYIERLESSLPGTKTRVIRTFGISHRRVSIGEMSSENAVELMMQRIRANEEQRARADQVKARLEAVRIKVGLPLSARNILYAYAAALEIPEGDGDISFDSKKITAASAGELSAKMREARLSEFQMEILSLIAKIRIPVKLIDLWDMYNISNVNYEELDFSDDARDRFFYGVNVLVDKGFLKVSGGEFFSLTSDSHTDAAQKIVPMDAEEQRNFANELINNIFSSPVISEITGDNVYLAQAELDHLFGANGHVRRITDLVQKLGKYYYSHGMMSAACGLYQIFQNNYGAIVTRQAFNEEIFFDIAWTYVASGNTALYDEAAIIYKMLEEAEKVSDKFRVQWRKYRLEVARFEGLSRNDKLARRSDYTALIDQFFNKIDLIPVCDTMLQEVKDVLIWTLKLSILHSLSIERKSVPDIDLREEKRMNLYRRMETLLLEKPVVSESLSLFGEGYVSEAYATGHRIVSALYKDLRDRTDPTKELEDLNKARDVGKVVHYNYDLVRRPVKFDELEYREHVLNTMSWLINARFNGLFLIGDISVRAVIDEDIADLMLESKELEKKCLLANNKITRPKALVNLCNAYWALLKAVSRAPLEGEDKSTALKAINDYVEIRQKMWRVYMGYKITPPIGFQNCDDLNEAIDSVNREHPNWELEHRTEAWSV